MQALSILRGQVCDPDEEQVKEKSAGNSALFTGCCSASLQSSKGSRRAASAASLFSLQGGCFFMKVVMINGSPHKNGSTAEALREVGHGLTDGGASRRNDDCADRAEPICTGGGTAHHPLLLLVHGARQHAGGSARRCRGDAHRLYAGQAHGGIHPKALLKTKQERGLFLSALLLRFIKLTARS